MDATRDYIMSGLARKDLRPNPSAKRQGSNNNSSVCSTLPLEKTLRNHENFTNTAFCQLVHASVRSNDRK